MLGLAALAAAAVVQPSMATCTISATGLAFGTYDTLRPSPNDSTGNVAVTCTGRRGNVFYYSIALASGTGAYTQRRMRSGTYALSYNLYLAPDRSVVWGDGNSGTGVISDIMSLKGASATRNYPVYGRIFSRQDVPVGIYTDSIVVTFDF